jgi:hypothetical protein
MTIEGRYRAAHRPTFAVAAADLLAQALAARGPIAPPNCPLSCAVVAQLAPVARDFDPPLMLELRQGTNGSLLLDGRYRVGDGPLGDFPLGDGSYTAELRGDHYRPQPFTLDWPPTALRTPLAAGAPVDVTLFPSTAYPYPDVTALPFNLGPTLLRGSVFRTDGTPEVGAVVTIPALPALNPPAPAWPFIQTETDASGDWALLLPDRRRFGIAGETTAQPPQSMTVHVQCLPLVGGRVLDFQNVPVTLGRENAVPNTSLRGQVTRAGGRPLGGVVITTSANALASRTRDDGRWTLYLDPNQVGVINVAVTATAPDGSTVTLNGVAIQSRATVVVPTLHLP